MWRARPPAARRGWPSPPTRRGGRPLRRARSTSPSAGCAETGGPRRRGASRRGSGSRRSSHRRRSRPQLLGRGDDLLLRGRATTRRRQQEERRRRRRQRPTERRARSVVDRGFLAPRLRAARGQQVSNPQGRRRAVRRRAVRRRAVRHEPATEQLDAQPGLGAQDDVTPAPDAGSGGSCSPGCEDLQVVARPPVAELVAHPPHAVVQLVHSHPASPQHSTLPDEMAATSASSSSCVHVRRMRKDDNTERERESSA